MNIKHIILSLALFTVHAAKSQNQIAIDSNYVFSGYTERLQHFKKMPVSRGSIVFLGNSLTEAGRWNDIIADRSILNRGISGDISYGVLARLEEVIRHKPKKVFLMIGVNDLKRNVPTTNIIQNYERIVQKIRQQSPQTTIYLNSILPVNPDKLIESFRAVTNNDIQVLNAGLRSLTKISKHVQYIDLHNVVADPQGNLRTDMTPDGIHLEVAAYVKIVNYLKRVNAL